MARQVRPLAPRRILVTPKLLAAKDDRISVEAVSHGEIINRKACRNISPFMMVATDETIGAVRENLDTEHVSAASGNQAAP